MTFYTQCHSLTRSWSVPEREYTLRDTLPSGVKFVRLRGSAHTLAVVRRVAGEAPDSLECVGWALVETFGRYSEDI